MARITRAQFLTSGKKKTEYYSDFMSSFAKTPVGDQLARVVNDRSIEQSLKNLMMTDVGERLFQPQIGSNIRAMLFENDAGFVASTAEHYIRSTIDINEPRVYLEDVRVDSSQDNNEVTISVFYSTINTPEPKVFNHILRRVR